MQQVLYKLLLAKQGIFNELGLPYHLERLADRKYLISDFCDWLILIRKDTILPDVIFP